MKRTQIIGAAAVVTAGIATYFIRKKLRSRKEKDMGHSTSDANRHITNVFAKAKLADSK